MAGKRRRLARAANPSSKVKVGQLRIKKPVPPKAIVLPGEDEPTQWDVNKTQKENYQALGLESDPTHGGGRNKKTHAFEERKEEFELDADETQEEKTFESDAYDELRAICNKERTSGKALPKRLSTTQRNVVQSWINAHGSNMEAMFRDRKLNPMQHSLGVIKQMVTSFIAYPCLENGGHRGFRAPQKSLGR
mmetsp:Transcript_32669/g.71364  ORF Transcript_32669/g.71364 Transcript_32669/m.71364 type:complete len:192 (-) Transcript_32669:449-1024(-)